MLKLRTDKQASMIINNIIRVIKTGNIDNLSKKAYEYLSVCSGFTSYYSIYGFKDNYRNTNNLKTDILDNQILNKNNSICKRINDLDKEQVEIPAKLRKDFLELTHDIDNIQDKEWIIPALTSYLHSTYEHSLKDIDNLIKEVFNKE